MTDWLVLTVLICICIYLTVMVFYFKTLLKKERTTRDFMKNNLPKLKIPLLRGLAKI